MPIRLPLSPGLLAACTLLLAMTSAPAAPVKMESHSYPVGHLLAWLNQSDGCAGNAGEAGKTEKQELLPDKLIGVILNTVRPATWSQNGGRGRIDYLPEAKTLVIHQAPKVHDEIEHLLADLRKQSDLQVALEVRLMTVSEACFERLGIDFDIRLVPEKQGQKPPAPKRAGEVNSETLGLAFLNDRQVRKLMEAAQGDRRINIMQAPRMVLLNGQAGSVDVTETHFFLTDLEIKRTGDDVSVINPNNEPVKLGFRMTAQPLVSADRRFVRLALKINFTDLASANVPLIPIQFPIKGDKTAGSNVFQMFLQQPQFSTLALENTVNLPDGNTAVFGGFKKTVEVRNESAPTLLSSIPCINRFTRNVGYGTQAMSLFIMVTPRIIVTQEEKENAGTKTTPAVWKE